MGLEARTLAKKNVRQPLQKIIVYAKESPMHWEEMVPLIAAEVNVKEVEFRDGDQGTVDLDVHVSEELKEEGIVREFERAVQAERKEIGFQPGEFHELYVSGSENTVVIIRKFKDTIAKHTSLTEVVFEDAVSGVTVDASTGPVTFSFKK
jgi:isoleucyl-tRNA synthetase